MKLKKIASVPWFMQLTAILQLTRITTSISGFYPVAEELVEEGLTFYNFGKNISHPLVYTGVGPIRGLWAEDGNYSMFMGVPYAQVDRNNIFGPAIPYPMFEDVYDAFDDSVKCPQIEEFNYTIVGTLDCLNLNIYVPHSASVENPAPVMVYIFGGFFRLGFPSRFMYGPRFIVRHDVILVVMNYRLGPYGFMCLDIPEIPGNQGLKDQVKALQWIKQHIHSFGGDNKRITLVGNSAGAVATDMHWYFDQEQLFHRLILQSGVAIMKSVVKKSVATAPLQLAEILNYTTNDIRNALSFLNTVDPLQLIAATNESGIEFAPCVEKQFPNVDYFMITHPNNIKTKRVQDVDIIIGLNDDEAYSKSMTMDKETFDSVDYVQYIIESHFNFHGDNKLSEEMAQIIRHFYFGDEQASSENRRPMMDLLSNVVYQHPVLRTVDKYLNSGIVNLYLYLFSYAGSRNFIKRKDNVTGGGASHADELGYLFDVSFLEHSMNDKDKLIMERMTELWTNFIKFGNPTPRLTQLVPMQWPRVTREKLHYLEIDTELRVDTRPLRKSMTFIDLLYKMADRGPVSAATHAVLFMPWLLLLIFK